MYVGRMKLTRNKIRKIRKQQHQSVRKWKKARKSPRRKTTTFRRSRTPMAEMDNIISSASSTDLPLKLKNVFNKTLKRYIPLPVLSYMKDKYDNMKRMRRKQRREKMIGGGKDDVAVAAAAAAASAAAAAVGADKSTIITDNNTDNATATDKNKDGADTGTATDNATATDKNKDGAATGPAKDGTTDKNNDGATDKDGAKKPAFNLGPEIQGDISIHSETFVLEKNEDAQKLLTFLVKNGLPYYIQLELKDDGKKFNRHDTEIFDLRRILCGKFATKKDFETDGKIPDNKRDLYFKAPDQVGIADGDTMGNEYPNDVFIYTGEKGQVDRSSADKSIKIAIAGNNSGPVVVLDSRRLYKLEGNGSPSTIDNFDPDVLKYGETVDPSEFRLQVAPMSEDDFKKAVATSSDGAKKKGKKVVTDDANSYVVNLSVGCKVTSIQTLRKALEMVRENLEDEEEDSKSAAMDVFKMLIALLNNPEFAKNEGFDDFKKSVSDFSYKIPGQERKYGFTQLAAFFTQKNDDVPPDLVKIFNQLLNLLGKGPMGEHGACAAFESQGLPLQFLTKVTPMADGKVKEVTTLTNKGNITSIEGILNGIQGDAAKKEGTDEAKDDAAKAEGNAAKAEGESAKEAAAKKDDEAKAEGEAAKAEGEAAKEGDAVKAEGESAKDEGDVEKAEGDAVKDEGAEAEAEAAAAAANTRPLTKEDIKEIDATDSFGIRYKAYLIRRFKFKDEPDMNMVHFMGWGTETDEFISATEEQKRILPRDEASKTGQGQLDKTIDDVMKLYKNVDMTKMESKAMEKSAEMKEQNAPAAAPAAASAAAAAAASAASAAATQRS